MPKTIHLIQAGVQNGDKAWLERAARQHLRSSPNWVVPKAAAVADDVVIYIGGVRFLRNRSDRLVASAQT